MQRGWGWGYVAVVTGLAVQEMVTGQDARLIRGAHLHFTRHRGTPPAFYTGNTGTLSQKQSLSFKRIHVQEYTWLKNI